MLPCVGWLHCYKLVEVVVAVVREGEAERGVAAARVCFKIKKAVAKGGRGREGGLLLGFVFKLGNK